jgi:hypothetical protein
MDHTTTIEQIGRMTLGAVGARRFVKSEDTLSFTLSRGHRSCTVRLNGDDTYTVTAQMIRSGKVTYTAEHIYCDQLSEAVWQSHLEN